MMNKEKLEQMKKERLEQMKELGRGGISKGLSFLRNSANTALSASATTGLLTAGATDEDGAREEESAAAGTGGASGNGKPSYDDLVSLSMKLTRQNKMMKAQFQKMQARILELQTRDADCQVLSSFVSDVVGVDVVACQLSEAKRASGDDNESSVLPTVDARQLKERYEILEALKQKALKQQLENLEAQIAGREPSKPTEGLLLPLSPAPLPPPSSATAGPLYDEIDLLSDPIPNAQAVSLPNSGVSSDNKSIEFVEKQLEEAREQIRRLDAELKNGKDETETLRQKLNEAWEQSALQVNQVMAEKNALEVQLAEVTSSLADVAITRAENKHLVESLQKQLADHVGSEQQLRDRISQLESQVTAEPAEGDSSALSAEIEKLRSSCSSLQSEKEALESRLETAINESNESSQRVQAIQATLNALEEERNVLVRKLQEDSKTEETASDASSPSSDEVSRLHERISELQNENETLRHSSAGFNEDVATMMQELESVKLERAESDHLTKVLQERLATAEKQLAKATNEVEQKTAVLEALQTEVTRLMDEVQQLDATNTTTNSTIAQLRSELEDLRTRKEGLEEELSMLRQDNTSNLESVVTELADAKKQIAQQREYMNAKVEELIRELDSARKNSDRLESELAEKEKQNQKMATSQTALTSEVMELQKQVSAMEEDLRMAAEGLEAHASRAEQADLRRQEMEEKLTNGRLQLEGLRDQHMKDLELLRSEKGAELDRVQQEKSKALKELNSLRSSHDELVSKSSALREELDREKQRSSESEVRLNELTAELGNLSIDMAETKKALSDRMALATRLQTENMGFAEKQAEQAARVETALREVAISKAAQVEAESKVKDAMGEMTRMRSERDETARAMRELQQSVELERSRMSQQLDGQAAKYKTGLDIEKEAFRKELERVENESKQKSKLALHAVLEKEAEIERLSKRLAELEEDVRSGDADNRKIFEFAQLQANREMEARANAARIHELNHELNTARARIQELQLEQARHGEELAAMVQTQRREGVNMEYLKNVIVQYMSFTPGSSQQTRLVPVITTLLQFTAADIKEIKKASRRSSWASWGMEQTAYRPIVVPSQPSNVTPRSASSIPHASHSDPSSRVSSFTLPEEMESASDPSVFSPHPTQRADF
ncbi:hypothetical protein Poli38472_002781 [Pythium oligandrum]|uniref:GRIP domain-containing protein n=1 Tax=Pythium oligandrum TaxID=41045 RepID=A0A8K1FHF3_PYTOL|nr:hypothetical protein Poli38472_002781 [Pythium oligandrum]|eukprot:TMW63840.1 hypothetical protein Poli38472_002781 [Pythium oligandrum]